MNGPGLWKGILKLVLLLPSTFSLLFRRHQLSSEGSIHVSRRCGDYWNGAQVQTSAKLMLIWCRREPEVPRCVFVPFFKKQTKKSRN